MPSSDTNMFNIWILAVSLCISVLIIVPLAGAIVRLRANYNPKGLRLDGEVGVEPLTGPAVTSMIGMIRRVYRIEVRFTQPSFCYLLMLFLGRDGWGCTKD
jgi:hypothetical protein